jgi:hypothetical protein
MCSLRLSVPGRWCLQVYQNLRGDIEPPEFAGEEGSTLHIFSSSDPFTTVTAHRNPDGSYTGARVSVLVFTRQLHRCAHVCSCCHMAITQMRSHLSCCHMATTQVRSYLFTASCGSYTGAQLSVLVATHLRRYLSCSHTGAQLPVFVVKCACDCHFLHHNGPLP